MSEQEYICDHEWEHEREGKSHRFDRDDEAVEIEDLEEEEGQRLSRWPARLLVGALLASFLLCLTALWFSGTLLSAPDQLLPVAFLQMVAAHRLLVLLVPTACLVICYGFLRSFTREIMAVPERYLDERQKMLRDQAHRSAFKIIKFACLLIPFGLLLPHLPWFNQPAPGVAPVRFYAVPSYIDTIHILNATLVKDYRGGPASLVWAMNQAIGPVIVPATTAEIILASVLLLLCLLLIVSALPMAVLAWKGRK
jgi:hypothetical protein